jgi:hypothetical protein
MGEREYSALLAKDLCIDFLTLSNPMKMLLDLLSDFMPL